MHHELEENIMDRSPFPSPRLVIAGRSCRFPHRMTGESKRERTAIIMSDHRPRRPSRRILFGVDDGTHAVEVAGWQRPEKQCENQDGIDPYPLGPASKLPCIGDKDSPQA